MMLYVVSLDGRRTWTKSLVAALRAIETARALQPEMRCTLRRVVVKKP
jgi:hypothetical protein